jgi:hypothetical protein
MWTLRPRTLAVQRGRRGQTAQIGAGKCTVPPGSKESWAWLGHGMVCCGQSRMKAVLGKRSPVRTGQALQ